MQIIPAVDVLDGAVVRLEQGRFDRVTTYGRDPVSAVAGFVDEGAEVVHVVDLGAARSGAADHALWEALGDAQLPFQAAGGIREARDAEEVLGLGAVRIVTGTTAVWNEAELRALVAAAGPALVVAVDVKDGRAVGAGWGDRGRPIRAVLAGAVEAGVARLMVTSVAGDGMLSGPDLPLISDIAAAAPLPVIASGGIGTVADIAAVQALGVEAVVIGRALYEERFTLAEALEAAR